MVGQGGPHTAPATSQRIVGRRSCAIFRLLPGLVYLCALLAAQPIALAQDTDLRLRIAWGGGESRQWRAVISVSEGEFSEPVPLGLEADVPGSIEVLGNQVRLTQRSPRTYDGIDILVNASLDATLNVVLSPRDHKTEPYRESIKLSKLIKEYHTAPVDDRKNTLLVRRAPGDRLRLLFNRDHLVFSPGERLSLNVIPHHVGLQPKSWFNCRVELRKGRTIEELWNATEDVQTADDGNLALIGPFDVAIPAKEGVYDVIVALAPNKRFTTPFNRPKPVVQRKLQLVVIDTESREPAAAEWQTVLEINPASPGWWDRMKRLPQLSLIPAFGRGPLGNDRSRTQTHHGQDLIELGVGGWQAYPLPITQIGMPHILEVEYPNDVKQTLGISIVEPNASGAVVPIGLDSGVDVPEPLAVVDREPRLLKHRLVFWPRTASPLLLLSNRRPDDPAAFGKLRVLSGPTALPPAPIDEDATGGRLIASYFDKPLFPENFCASEARDQWTGRSHDDWATFYQGGSRLTQYLKHVGYNGAIVSVLCDGSTIYPSNLLQPTPKYDSGIFFITGQDPLRKDVLEMMFRLFDSKGLKLVPSISFSSPLPSLEKVLQRGDDEAIGIELINDEGTRWLSQFPARHGSAPYYNPLDARVQRAMVDVVAEIARRYGHHESFGGISLQLGENTYAQLPGDRWGLDDKTIEQFQQAEDIKIPGQGEERFAARGRYLKVEKRHEWLSWRAKQIATLYSAMLGEIEQAHADAKLYINAAESITSTAMQTGLRPTLPSPTLPTEPAIDPQSQRENPAMLMLQIGIDPRLYRDQPNLVLLRPQRHAPIESFTAQATNIHLQHAPQFDELFGGKQDDKSPYYADHPATIFFHEPHPVQLPSFEQKSPYGPERTQIWLVPQISPSGALNRRRIVHSLATLDAQSILDGGWMIPLGQEDALREIVEVYRRLPAGRFETVKPRRESSGQGVVVRTKTHGDRTFAYFVNDSPWKASIEVDFVAPPACELRSLDRRPLAALAIGRDGATWRAELRPYDLVGIALTLPNVKITDWRVTVPEGLVSQLRPKVAQVQARVNALDSPPTINVLTNAGFESPSEQGGIPGWVHARGVGVEIKIDDSRLRRGERSLRAEVRDKQAIAWIRSKPFATPKTGRVSVVAWLKIDDAKRQPPFRLAIEGRHQGQVYYKYATVGLGNAKAPLTTEWKQYIFHVDDLPPTGLTDLRVGFDLMGTGKVWIDEVQVFDRWFYKNERHELLKSVGAADHELGKGTEVPCQRFLESYWPRFLEEHVPLQPHVAQNTRATQPPIRRPLPPEPEKPPSMYDRMRGWLPKLPF